MSIRLLTWQQKLVLRAAAAVDYLSFRAALQGIPNGVYRSLVIRGYLLPHSRGWEIVPEIRMRWKHDHNYQDEDYYREPKPKPDRKEKTMALPRYYVEQGHGTNVWRLLDRLKLKMHDDVLGTFPTRAEARVAAATLNKLEHRDNAPPAPEHDAVVPGEAT